MNILEDHNEWEPTTITLDYKVYKDLLNKVADYPKIMKQLEENGTHTLLKLDKGSQGIVYAIVDNNVFKNNIHQFKKY